MQDRTYHFKFEGEGKEDVHRKKGDMFAIKKVMKKYVKASTD